MKYTFHSGTGWSMTISTLKKPLYYDEFYNPYIDESAYEEPKMEKRKIPQSIK